MARDSTRLLLVATGDTMAYKLDPSHAGIATGAELLAAALPGGRPGLDITIEDRRQEPSWDTDGPTLLALARRVRAALGEELYDGVVVTHGLDTVAEAAFLADLMLGAAAARGAVVFTCALRPFDAAEPDGPGSLAVAISAAADPRLRGAGVLVGTGDELHAARWVSVRDVTGEHPALSSWPRPPVARVVAGRVEELTDPPPRPPGPLGDPEWDVALVKTYPGMAAVVLGALADAGVRGIVLAGTGVGNVPVSLLTTIGDLVSWDIPVVVASDCRTGPVDVDALSPEQGMAFRVGAIPANGLAPAQARAALMVALGGGGDGRNVATVRSYFAAR
ncbi:asparaginase domain-containing protein [Plantactinospora sp. GCM10030261]|uniref:asparaginase domain-containing protein n=1 Tax=Plantactinospora sp. GCM10030261 TaxID=3273420 RepID=UPI003610D29D